MKNELMCKIVRGDELAFETTMNRHKMHILNLIYRFIGFWTQVEDVIQKVYHGNDGQMKDTNLTPYSQHGSIVLQPVAS